MLSISLFGTGDFKEWFIKYLSCTSVSCASKNRMQVTKFPQIHVERKVASLPGPKGDSWDETWAGKEEQDPPVGE